MSKVTIEDISRHTGLSRGTVSRALNNRPDISIQTKERVLDACQQLHYVPSHAARSLATGRSYAVMVVVDDLRAPFSAAVLRGVLERAREERYAVHLCELGPAAETTLEQLCSAANERVDSVLVACRLPTDTLQHMNEALDKRPIVACAPADGIACDSFVPDHAEAGRLVARHILRGSAPDVAYVSAGSGGSVREQLNGFCEICREHQIPPESVVVETPTHAPGRLEALRGRLGTLRAVAASDDLLAIDVMMLCREVGRLPGRDIAVMGQGNSLAGTRISPALSTIDFCGDEIGRRAMDMALQRIAKSRQDAPQRTLVAPVLVARETTANLA